MKVFATLVLGFFLACSFAMQDAEAKRLGGGKSFGKQRSFTERQATPPTQSSSARQATAAGGTAATSGARRWLGPLAGLAAGGLLASLFFGDAFSGFQIMDFLLLALLAFVAFKLFKYFRQNARGASSSAYQRGPMATAGGSRSGGFETPNIGENLGRPSGGHSVSPHHEAPVRVPEWFDEGRFLDDARAHFLSLQAAWDCGDMDKVREFTTPELFSELAVQRQSLGGDQFTDVVDVDAQLLDFAIEGKTALASVLFKGQIREDEQGPSTPFAEVWNVERALDQAEAPWYVAGIQQQGD